jgi:hypothetical protein
MTLMPIRISWLILFAAFPAMAAPQDYFKIQVVDAQTGRGVPLVELETTNNILNVTDSNGIVAFNEPGLMGRKIFFHVRSHGYEFPKDGFGFAGVGLDVKAGQSATAKIKRLNIAERLYRVTGQGIYRDSILVGESAPISEPLLNGQVTGQDTVMTIPYRGKLYWFWGDTNRPSYPLGQFATSGATSEIPGKGGLDPSLGVNLTYFVDENGFSKKMCPLPGEGLVWIEGLVTVPDESSRERLLCRYTRMRGLEAMLEHGLAMFDDGKEMFLKHKEFDLKLSWQCPQARPVRVKQEDGDWYYFPASVPNVRVKADLKSITDQDEYQAYTCLKEGTKYEKASSKIERDAEGRPIYRWVAGTDPIGPGQEPELIKAGLLKPEQTHFLLVDIEGGKPVIIHNSTVYWNTYRKKWIMIAQQVGGTSFLGETWFSESDQLTGPWKSARKIITHNKYSFYNVAHHPEFDQAGGRLIYLEGTYVNTFSGNPFQTPRYDYNQVMYRLDLADQRLKLKE